MEKVYDCVNCLQQPKGKFFKHEVFEDFESRPHTAVTLSRKRKGKTGMERATTAEGVTWKK